MTALIRLSDFTPQERADLIRLRAAWQQRDELPAYRPAVPDDADEPWGVCLHDLAPTPPLLRLTPKPVHRQQTRAGRRTVKQRLRALLPRLDLRPWTDGYLP